MRIKKSILFLAFFLVLQLSYRTVSLPAQGDKDALEIKEVVETFLKNCVNNTDKAMQLVSTNYYDVMDNITVDYEKFKLGFKNAIKIFKENYLDYSDIYFHIDKLNIQDGKADIEIEHGWKGFNLNTLNEESRKSNIVGGLVKENGSWRITKWKRTALP